MRRTGTDTRRQRTNFTHGGARPGAGRKPKGAVALAPHDARPRMTRREPVLVTTHVLPDLPDLRRARTVVALQRALSAGAERSGFRLVEYSIQPDHLRLIAQGDDARSVTRGIQGLLVRVAKALNRAWGRRGTVFSDRYRAQVLGSRRAVRDALVHAPPRAGRTARGAPASAHSSRGRRSAAGSTGSRAHSARSRAPASAPG